jgi:hypothetical protein
MNCLTKFLMQALSTFALLMMWPACCEAQDASFFEAIGRVIRQAVGADDPPPEAFADPAMEAGPDGVIPAERDREELAGRLKVYSDAMQSWVSQACMLPEEQRLKMKELFDATLKKDVDEFAKSKDPNRRNQSFPNTFPVLFARDDRPASAFSKKVVATLKKDLLTVEQIAVLEEKLTERASFHHRAYLRFVVGLIDKELYLTTAQREALIAELDARPKEIRHPLYSFQPQSYYFPYEAVSSVIPKTAGNELLEPSQKKRLQDLNGSDPNSQHIIFQASSGVDGWYKQMNEASLQQREKFLRAAAVRVSFYQKELNLSDEQALLLVTASKGAAVRAIGDWKETTQQTFEQMEQQIAQMGGNFGFGAQNIDTRRVDQNEIWIDAVKSVGDSDVYEKLKLQRNEAERDAVAECVLALLDEELWLLPEQRVPLISQIENSLPRKSDPAQYQEYIREVILFAHPLFSIPEKTRDESLMEAQREVWKKLQTFFQYQKANNYVQIQLRNNGGSFGFMLERK